MPPLAGAPALGEVGRSITEPKGAKAAAVSGSRGSVMGAAVEGGAMGGDGARRAGWSGGGGWWEVVCSRAEEQCAESSEG